MSYEFYIDDFLLPIAPSKLVTKIINKNQTINLVNSKEINILKDTGLTELEFEFMLPQSEYSFATYKSGFLPANYFLDRLSYIKNNKKSVRFTVVRNMYNNKESFNLNMRVSIEDYSIIESSEEGLDIVVYIKLKQYNVVNTKTGYINSNNELIINETRPFFEDEKKTYIMKDGDNLFDICHMILGDGDLCKVVAEKNGLKSPYDASFGMLIRFDL